MTGAARESRAFLPVLSALRGLADHPWVAAQAKTKQYEKDF